MASRLDLERYFGEHKHTLLVGLAGLFLLGIGILSAIIVSLNRDQPQVEIVSVQEKEELGMLVVDIAGAVLVPGVYRLPAGARVEDALVAAGGLAAQADREWIDKYINRAQSISDGVKIYIPSTEENLEDESQGAGITPRSQGAVIGITAGEKVNINVASLQQLDSLWGIGEIRAQAIIDHRPYADPAELVTRAGIPKNVFERIKEAISLY